jgi:hypothetical protein
MLSQLGGAMGGKGGAGGIFGQLLGMVGPLLSMFGGKGGGGVAGNIGESIGGLFYNGGYVPNFALGKDPIIEAYRREKTMSGGRQPMLAMVNSGEFIFSAAAVDRLGRGALEYAHKEGRFPSAAIPNFAAGGIYGQASTLGSSPGIDSSQGTTAVGSGARAINLELSYTRMGEHDFIHRKDLDAAVGNINSRMLTSGDAISATAKALRSSPQLRRSIAMGRS